MNYIVHGVAKSWTQLSDFHFHFTCARYWLSTLHGLCQFLPQLSDIIIFTLFL